MPDARPVSATDSGITGGRDVTQSAGRDAAGRDIFNINVLLQLLDGSMAADRKWTGTGAEAAREVAQLRTRVQRDYEERLRQMLGDTLKGLELALRTAPELVVDRLSFLPGAVTSGRLLPDADLRSLLLEDDLLLVLGGPGAGKTTLLLQLAADVLEQDTAPNGPTPLIVPLARWGTQQPANSGLPLEEHFQHWLAEAVKELYQVTPRQTRDWIAEHRLVLLLDGLDEVGDLEARTACLEAVNAFVSARSARVVLTCRLDEYEALPIRARFERAVVVQPLDPDAVLGFVESSGSGRHGSLATRLRHDPDLLAMCTSPLLLGILMLTDPWPEHDDAPSGSRADRIVDQYVAQRLEQRPSQVGGERWSPASHRRWLNALARGTRQQARSVFFIEHVAQAAMPARWPWRIFDRLPLHCLALGIVLLSARDGNVMVDASQYVSVVLLFLLVQGSVADTPASMTLRLRQLRAIPWYAVAAMGCLGAFMGGAMMRFQNPGMGAIRLFPGGPLAAPPLIGCAYGLLIGLLLAVIASCASPREITSKREPYDSYRDSLVSSAVIAGVIALSVLAMAVVIPLLTGMQDRIPPADYLLFRDALPPLYDQGLRIASLLALTFTLIFSSGLAFVVLYPWQRLLVHVSGQGPLDYLRWLDEMVARRILYRSGTGFVFMHERLHAALAKQE